MSVALQGPTVEILARRLGVVAEDRVSVRPEIVPVDALDADLVEVTVVPDPRLDSATLRELPPPGGSRVAVLRRNEQTIIPNGSTMLLAGDVLLAVTPERCDLDELEAWSRATPAAST